MSLFADGITFGYTKEREILSDISFTLPFGQSLFLLGPNGTGKTTLLKCINHLLVPRKGRCLSMVRTWQSFRQRNGPGRSGMSPSTAIMLFPLMWWTPL